MSFFDSPKITPSGSGVAGSFFSIDTEEQVPLTYEEKMGMADAILKEQADRYEAIQQALYESERERELEATRSQSFLGDMRRLVESGAVQMGEAGGYVLEQMGAEKLGQFIQEKSQERHDRLMAELTPEMQEGMQKKFWTDAEGEGGFGEAWTDPRAIAAILGQSAAGTLGGMGLGSVLTKTLRWGVMAHRAKAVRDVAGGVVEGLSKGQQIGTAMVGYGLGEGSVVAPLAGLHVVKEIRGADYAELAELEPFQDAYAATDKSLSHEERLELAREKVALSAFLEVAGKNFAVSSVLGAPTGIALDKLASGFKLIKKGGKWDILSASAIEVVQESVQEGSETVLGNLGVQKYVDPTRKTTEGLAEAMTAGGIAGGVMGAGAGAVAKGVGVKGAPARRAEELVRSRDAAENLMRTFELDNKQSSTGLDKAEKHELDAILKLVPSARLALIQKVRDEAVERVGEPAAPDAGAELSVTLSEAEFQAMEETPPTGDPLTDQVAVVTRTNEILAPLVEEAIAPVATTPVVDRTVVDEKAVAEADKLTELQNTPVEQLEQSRAKLEKRAKNLAGLVEKNSENVKARTELAKATQEIQQIDSVLKEQSRAPETTGKPSESVEIERSTSDPAPTMPTESKGRTEPVEAPMPTDEDAPVVQSTSKPEAQEDIFQGDDIPTFDRVQLDATRDTAESIEMREENQLKEESGKRQEEGYAEIDAEVKETGKSREYVLAKRELELALKADLENYKAPNRLTMSRIAKEAFSTFEQGKDKKNKWFFGIGAAPKVKDIDAAKPFVEFLRRNEGNSPYVQGIQLQIDQLTKGEAINVVPTVSESGTQTKQEVQSVRGEESRVEAPAKEVTTKPYLVIENNGTGKLKDLKVGGKTVRGRQILGRLAQPVGVLTQEGKGWAAYDLQGNKVGIGRLQNDTFEAAQKNLQATGEATTAPESLEEARTEADPTPSMPSETEGATEAATEAAEEVAEETPPWEDLPTTSPEQRKLIERIRVEQKTLEEAKASGANDIVVEKERLIERLKERLEAGVQKAVGERLLEPNSVEAVMEEIFDYLGYDTARKMIDSGRLRIVEQEGGKGEKIKEGDAILGYYEDGVITLVAPNIEQGRVSNVFRHEALHRIMASDPLLVEQAKKFLDGFAKLRASSAAVEKAYRFAEAREGNADKVNEEALGYFVMNDDNINTPLFQQLIAKVRAWLFRHGINLELTEADYVEIVQNSIKQTIKNDFKHIKPHSDSMMASAPANAQLNGLERQASSMQKALDKITNPQARAATQAKLNEVNAAIAIERAKLDPSSNYFGQRMEAAPATSAPQDAAKKTTGKTKKWTADIPFPSGNMSFDKYLNVVNKEDIENVKQLLMTKEKLAVAEKLFETNKSRLIEKRISGLKRTERLLMNELVGKDVFSDAKRPAKNIRLDIIKAKKENDTVEVARLEALLPRKIKEAQAKLDAIIRGATSSIEKADSPLVLDPRPADDTLDKLVAEGHATRDEATGIYFVNTKEATKEVAKALANGSVYVNIPRVKEAYLGNPRFKSSKVPNNVIFPTLHEFTEFVVRHELAHVEFKDNMKGREPSAQERLQAEVRADIQALTPAQFQRLSQRSAPFNAYVARAFMDRLNALVEKDSKSDKIYTPLEIYQYLERYYPIVAEMDSSHGVEERRAILIQRNIDRLYKEIKSEMKDDGPLLSEQDHQDIFFESEYNAISDAAEASRTRTTTDTGSSVVDEIGSINTVGISRELAAIRTIEEKAMFQLYLNNRNNSRVAEEDFSDVDLSDIVISAEDYAGETEVPLPQEERFSMDEAAFEALAREADDKIRSGTPVVFKNTKQMAAEGIARVEAKSEDVFKKQKEKGKADAEFWEGYELFKEDYARLPEGTLASRLEKIQDFFIAENRALLEGLFNDLKRNPYLNKTSRSYRSLAEQRQEMQDVKDGLTTPEEVKADAQAKVAASTFEQAIAGSKIRTFSDLFMFEIGQYMETHDIAGLLKYIKKKDGSVAHMRTVPDSLTEFHYHAAAMRDAEVATEESTAEEYPYTARLPYSEEMGDFDGTLLTKLNEEQKERYERGRANFTSKELKHNYNELYGTKDFQDLQGKIAALQKELLAEYDRKNVVELGNSKKKMAVMIGYHNFIRGTKAKKTAMDNFKPLFNAVKSLAINNRTEGSGWTDISVSQIVDYMIQTPEAYGDEGAIWKGRIANKAFRAMPRDLQELAVYRMLNSAELLYEVWETTPFEQDMIGTAEMVDLLNTVGSAHGLEKIEDLEYQRDIARQIEKFKSLANIRQNKTFGWGDIKIGTKDSPGVQQAGTFYYADELTKIAEEAVHSGIMTDVAIELYKTYRSETKGSHPAFKEMTSWGKWDELSEAEQSMVIDTFHAGYHAAFNKGYGDPSAKNYKAQTFFENNYLSYVKVGLAEELFSKELEIDGDFFKDFVTQEVGGRQPIKEAGITEMDLFEMYMDGSYEAAKFTFAVQKRLADLEAQKHQIAFATAHQAAIARGDIKRTTAEQIAEASDQVAKALNDQIIAQKRTKAQVEAAAKEIVNNMLEGHLELQPKEFATEFVDMGTHQEMLITIADIKSNHGLDVLPEDIFVDSPAMVNYEQLQQVKNSLPFYVNQIGMFRNGQVQEYYEDFASYMGAELIVVNDPNLSSTFLPPLGGSSARVVVNVQLPIGTARVYAQHAFSKLSERLSGAQLKVLQNYLTGFAGEALSNKVYSKESMMPVDSKLHQAPLPMDSEANVKEMNKRAFDKRVREMKEVRHIMTDAQAQQFVLSEIASVLMTQPSFYQGLSTRLGGKEMAAGLISELMTDIAVGNTLQTKLPVFRNFEAHRLMGDRSFDDVAMLIADIVLSEDGIAKAKNSLHNSPNRMYAKLGTAAAEEMYGVLKAGVTAGGIKANGFWRTIFGNAKSYKDVMTNIEAVIRQIPYLVRDLKPKFMFSDFMADPTDTKLAHYVIHGAVGPMTQVQEDIKNRFKHVYDGMSDEDLVNLHDRITKGVYMKDGEKVVAEPLDLMKEEDVKTALAEGISQPVIDAFVYYKEESNKIYEQLKVLYPDLPFLETHYGQSYKWQSKKTGLPLSNDVDSVIFPEGSRLEGRKQFLQERNMEMTTSELEEAYKASPQLVNPHDVFIQYVHDTAVLLNIRKMVDQGIALGRVQLHEHTDEGARVALRNGLHMVDDNAFVIHQKIEGAEATETIAGYEVVEMNNNNQMVRVRLFPSRESAEKFATGEQTVRPNKVAGPQESKVLMAYFKPDLAVMLRNAMSKDHFRHAKIGKMTGAKLINLKHHSVSIEFMLNMFHLWTIGMDTVTSEMAFRQMKAKNWREKLGSYNIYSVLKGAFRDARDLNVMIDLWYRDQSVQTNVSFQNRMKEIFKVDGDVNFKDLLDKAINVGWFKEGQDPGLRGDYFKLGEMKYTDGAKAYLNDADQLVIKSAFQGMNVLGRASHVAKNVVESVQEVYNKELVRHGSTGKAIFNATRFGAFEVTSNWLMEKTTPRLKTAIFMKEYLHAIENNAENIQNGTVLPEHLAHMTMKFVEDRLGEANWKSQHNHKALNSTLIFGWRSFTWWSGIYKSLGKAYIDLGKQAWYTVKGEKRSIGIHGLWYLNAIYAHLAVAAMFNAMYMIASGFDDEEVPSDPNVSLMSRILYPRGNPKDPRERYTIPSYITEQDKIFHHVGLIGGNMELTKLVSGRFNTILGNLAEAYNGQDFRGMTVRDKEANPFVQAFQFATHIFKITPISYSSLMKDVDVKGFRSEKLAMAMMGFIDAPAHSRVSPATTYVYSLTRGKYSSGMTKDDLELSNETRRAAYQYAQGNKDPLMALLGSGKIGMRQYNRAIEYLPLINGRPNPKYVSPLENGLKRVSVEEAVKTWHRMTDEEKRDMRFTLLKKYKNTMRDRQKSRDDKEKAREAMRSIGFRV